MYNKNIREPSTVPWGTPDNTETGFDNAPSTTTVWVCSVSHDWIYFHTRLSVLWYWNLARRHLWDTVSKALLKSSKLDQFGNDYPLQMRCH